MARLTDNLVSFWSLEEASGNALDGYGTNHLTAINAPGSAVGKVGNARTFVAGLTQYFQIAANASLTLGADTDFCASGWIKKSALTGAGTFIGQWENLRAWGLGIKGTGEYEVLVYSAAGALSRQAATAFGVIPLNAWNWVKVWHDSTANVIGIKVNNGTANTLAHAGGTMAAAGKFIIGSDGLATLFTAEVDQWGFWKGRVTSAAEDAALYNDGLGLPLSQVLTWQPGPSYFGTLFDALRTKIGSAWPEVKPPTGGGIYHALEIADVAFEEKVGNLPFAVVDYDLSPNYDAPLVALEDMGSVSIHYVAKLTSTFRVKDLFAKCELLRNALWGPSSTGLARGQVREYPQIRCSFDMPVNRHFRGRQMPYIAAAVVANVAVGNTF